MNEINLSKRIVEERHKKKVTQEELAGYIGVSKAAVSKWESGSSFPDITCLPGLATYFNISIDELMGYSPQMTREEIRKKYCDLKQQFAEKPFSEVYEICEELIKKYYSCFPFLLQMTILYLNHAPLAENPTVIYKRATELAERVKEMGEDVNDAKQAETLLATIYLVTGEPMKALDLMDEKIRPMSQDTELLAQIYQSTGNREKAIEVFQIGMYQHLVTLVFDSAPYMMLYAGDEVRVREIIKRTMLVAEVFEMDGLHPNTMANVYIAAATVYCGGQMQEEALDMLKKYTELCVNSFFPFTLHGDEYFDRIDGWFEEFDIGNEAPRSEKLIRESMVQAVKENPAFTVLHQNPEYRNLISRLEQVCKK